MARTVTVPQYTRTESEGTNIIRINSTSPGTTDNTGTTVNGTLAAVAYYYTPNVANTVTSALLATFSGRGWIIQGTEFVPLTTDGFEFDSFTAPQITIHYSRGNALLTGNVVATLTASLYRVDANDVHIERLCRGSASITFMPTEQSVVITMAADVASTVFAPGEQMALDIHFDKALTLVSDGDCRLHTNSTTATRITSFPSTFDRSYNKTLTDTDADGVTDALTRVYTSARTITDVDATGVTDVLSRVATFPRSLSDVDANGVTDAIARVFTGSRTIADTDSDGVLDSIARIFTGARTLTDVDATGVTDVLSRAFTGSRTLTDTDANGVVDALARLTTFNRALSDTDADGVIDVLARQFTGFRSLTDTDADGVVDVIARDLIYGRTLLDNLTSGGGTTTTRIFAVLD